MRRFLKFSALLLALAFLLIGLSPYWLGGVLPTIARRFGATYDTYSRVGYGRFALERVVVRRTGVIVHVSRVEADTPWLWALRHLAHADHVIAASDWEVETIEHPPKPGQPREASGWVPLHGLLSRLGRTLDRWLPHATLGAGRVRWPGDELSLAAGEWQKRTLRVQALQWHADSADVVVAFAPDASSIQVQGKMLSRNAAFQAESRGERVAGVLTAWNQTAPFEFHFPEAKWMPASGKVAVEDWRIPANDLKLSGYTEVQGSVHATWDHERFGLEADLHGHPVEGQGAPELHVIARANGDRTAYTVEQLDLVAPGIVGKLTEPIHSTFHDSVAGPASRFTLSANLAEVPWFKAEGTLNAAVNVEPKAGHAPVFHFTGTADKLGYNRWTATAVRLQGELDWPRLSIASADLTSVDNTHLAVSGACDFRAKELSAVRVEGRITAGLLEPWLPKDVTFAGADLVLKASGPWATAEHEGAVKLEQLSIPGFVPAAARLWWQGKGAAIQDFETGIRAAATEIVASGSVQRDGVQLKKLTWRHNEEERLALSHPANLHWGQKLSVDAFDLAGKAGELRLAGSWGSAGEIRFYARGIAGEWWKDFLPPAPFGWSIDTFTLNANWDNGPATVDTSGLLLIDLEGRDRISLDLAAHSDGSSVILERLRALEQDHEFATLHGKLPIAVWVAPKPRVEIGRSADISIQGHVDPAARWWAELGDRTGLHLDQPDLSIQLDGTWEQPRGTATLNIARLQIDQRFGKNKLPKIEQVHLQLVADGDHLRLQPAEAVVEGQPLSLSAALPTHRETWDKLRKAPMEVLRDELEISIQAKDTDVAALAPYASGVLLPQGRLDADLTLSVRGDWKGYLRLRNLATRPLGSMGPLRDIRADLELQGRRFVMKSVEAAMGGQPMKAQGFVEFPVGGEPNFNFSATGENLPFVRQAGLLVRGNVNFKVVSGRKGATPLVSGEVQLREGLFLSDVRALVPHGGGASPERRPPYFSISAEPFNLWRLDVNVVGDRFLRARTTLFTGVASTKLHLLGTLGEPRALGEVRIEEGQVLLPFARFSLTDATVRLGEANPYDPQLAVFGTSRRYGYDIKLELTGSASSPLLVFTSNPPLSSEQVLLMVMAGETPKNEVNYTTTQRFARLGQFFGQSLLDSLGGGGDGSDRLTISSGEQVSQYGHKETYQVQYQLDERWSLVGEYDEFDEYNVGLKWRLLPKHLRDGPNEKR